MTGKSERPSKRPSGALSNLGAADADEPSASPNASKQPKGTAPGLYVIATPIGNSRDITLRALDALNDADVIACEDTRVTSKLLSIHGISHKPLMSYHDHNAAKARPKIMEHLHSGKIVALVSDAGTPLINDPGFDLITACRNADVPVIALPGASAVTTALVLAGLPTDRFMYCGFPHPKVPRGEPGSARCAAPMRA
jgi:16S rRNA (cytidine1402-2'-O)-methyltransferase